jgi:hypothetical protein
MITLIAESSPTKFVAAGTAAPGARPARRCRLGPRPPEELIRLQAGIYQSR